MPRSSTNGTGAAKVDRRTQTPAHSKADEQGLEAMIAQAEALKLSLRDTLQKTSELISGLKRHRKQTKAVAATLASLKQLRGVV